MNYKYLKMDESVPLSFTHNHLVITEYAFQASNLMNTSNRDIYPRFGQLIQFNFNNTPFESSSNSIFAMQTILDFPGIARHHGLRLYGAYQKKTEPDYTFSDFIILPRGYDQIFRNQLASFFCSLFHAFVFA